MIEGAGGVITDWKGHQLQWDASSDSRPLSMLLTPFLSHMTCLIQFDCLAHLMDQTIFFPSFLYTGFNVVAAGDKQLHQQALDSLEWQQY